MAEREGFEPSLEFFGPQNGFWLASKLLRTIDAVRLALDGLGTVGSVLG
jgi:hypothetical protein